MVTRAELRHACFRMKNKAQDKENEETVKCLDGKLNKTQTWDEFSITWDVLIDRKGEISVISPEADKDFIEKTCAERHFVEKHGTKVEWTPRQENVLSIVEVHMLEGSMTWANYSESWGVYLDPELKRISTKLYTSPTQTEVTPVMIEASKVSDDDKPLTPAKLEEVELTASQMSPSALKEFKKKMGLK